MKFMPIAYVMMIVECCVSILGIVRYRELNKPLKYLVWTIIFWFFAGIVERIMGIYGIHNLWFTQFNTLIGFVLFARIYFLWRPNRVYGFSLIVSFVCFIVFWIIAKFTFEPLTRGDDITSVVSAIIILIASMYIMIYLLKEITELWQNDPRFWVSAAFIIYSAGTFFLFFLFTYMLQFSREVLFIVYPINWVLIIISHILFARGILCKVPQEIYKIKNPVNAGLINTSQPAHRE
jgi:hypothetical protein